jgi:hypothetical protein
MEKIQESATKWLNSNAQVFWGEIAACDHAIQVYDCDKSFLNTLEGFATSGFLNDEAVIVIATPEHLERLNERISKAGFDIKVLIASDQYIPVDAHEALAEFLVNDWPDEERFKTFISKVIARARYGNRRVRAFGEMVAVLWEKGLSGATVHLEKLWCALHENDSFALYCAYPKSGFTQEPCESINKICNMHSRIIRGESIPSTMIYHRHTKEI